MSHYHLTHTKCYDIIHYTPQAVYYIPGTQLFYNRKQLPLNSLPLFHLFPQSLHSGLFNVSMNLFHFCFSFFRFFLQVKSTVFVLFCLTYFTYHNTLQVHPQITRHLGCFHIYIYIWLSAPIRYDLQIFSQFSRLTFYFVDGFLCCA